MGLPLPLSSRSHQPIGDLGGTPSPSINIVIRRVRDKDEMFASLQRLFAHRRDPFTHLDLVFMDTRRVAATEARQDRAPRRLPPCSTQTPEIRSGGARCKRRADARVRSASSRALLWAVTLHEARRRGRPCPLLLLRCQ
jgi:hypothetical protein